MLTKTITVAFMTIGVILLTACGQHAQTADANRAIEEFRQLIAYEQRMCSAGNAAFCGSAKTKLEELRAINDHDLAALKRMCNPMNISACSMYAAVSGKKTRREPGHWSDSN
jgi:hypothetical protein